MEKSIVEQVDDALAKVRYEFNKAYLDLQQSLPKLVKASQGHGYRYVSLSDVLGAVLPLLREHGFTIRFTTWSPDTNSVGVRAILTHVATGQVMASEILAEPERCVGGRMNGIQARGAYLTYAQRYCLLAVLGSTADVDTDAATLPAAPQAPQNRDPGWGAPPPPPPANAAPGGYSALSGGVGSDGLPF